MKSGFSNFYLNIFLLNAMLLEQILMSSQQLTCASPLSDRKSDMLEGAPSSQSYTIDLSKSNPFLDPIRQQVEKAIPRKTQKGISRPFSRLEDELILHLVDRFGPKFKKFTKFFTGRQANILKNRYYKTLRFQQGQEEEQERRRPKNNVVQPVPPKQQLRQLLSDCNYSPEAEDVMKSCLDGMFKTFDLMLNC